MLNGPQKAAKLHVFHVNIINIFFRVLFLIQYYCRAY
jgi:hypothetical protein